MKAEELFVGALVRVNHDGLCIRKGTIVEVRAVDADNKLIEKGLVGSAHCRPLDDDQFEGGIWCEYLEPIPLTPEILEKNGFERSLAWHNYKRTYGEYFVNVQLGYANKIDYVEIREGGKDDVVPSEKTRLYLSHISYVHELQHALRLCGIEKEIEL